MKKTFEQLPAELKALFATPLAPAVDGSSREGRLAVDRLDTLLEPALKQASLASWAASRIRCLALLWHDHLQAAHEICQSDSSVEGCCLHGIMHRREGDFSNSRYWFRTAGRHEVFKPIGSQVEAYLRTLPADDLAAKLIEGGEWVPTAFVDVCMQVHKQPATEPRVQRLQEIQKLEFQCWLAYLVQR